MRAIPIEAAASPAQVEALRPIVEGRACVVIGSAPLTLPTAQVNSDELAIPVNGAISSLHGVPPLWILNSKAQDHPGASIREMHRVMLQQAANRSAGHICFLRGPKVASEQSTLAALKNLRCTHASWSILDKSTKRWMEGELCDRKSDKQPCSSGMLTIAMVLWCGAASVRTLGISFKPGYNYLKEAHPPSWWRDHVEADKRALKALHQRYGSRLIGELVREVAA